MKTFILLKATEEVTAGRAIGFEPEIFWDLGVQGVRTIMAIIVGITIIKGIVMGIIKLKNKYKKSL